MKADIQCTICGAVMGTLEKDVIVAADVALYQAQETCPNGHKATALPITDPTEGMGDGG